jgi:exodeoxyribonuclease VII large subunit
MHSSLVTRRRLAAALMRRGGVERYCPENRMESGLPEPDPALARETITVSLLNRAVAELLTQSFRLVRVRGEIANFTRAASGHWYFTLKDDRAQVRCAMFRGRNQLAGFQPREGDEVEVLAQVGLYEPRGEYQLTVESLRRSGLGRLYARFLELKSRLQAEGLFDAKRPLPAFPRTIGVVTSLQAAALRDVLSTLARRSPHVAVIVYPVPVQGEGAGGRIAAMLDVVSRRAEVDVVLLVRGGGSIEDLWAFNEEAVARAIRACAVPVIVGVGHESDVTIADFAADLRAPTPTAAAEQAAPERAALLGAIDERAARLRRVADTVLQRAQQRLDYAQRTLSSPRAPIQALAQRVHALRLRAGHALARQLDGRRRRAAQLAAALRSASPRPEAGRLLLQRRCAALAAGARSELHRRQQQLQDLASRLHALDPHAVLSRGYALAYDTGGRVVKDAGRLAAGDLLQLRFARGAASARVERTDPADAEARPRGRQGDSGGGTGPAR